MKTLIAKIGAIVLAGFVAVSCSKPTDQSNGIDDGITTLWENTSGTRVYAADSAEARVSVIQSIKAKHPVAKDFLAELKKNGIDEDDLDLTQILRTGMTGSGAVILSVPDKRTGEKVMAYNFKKEYCIIQAALGRDIQIYKTIDGVPLRTFRSLEGGFELISDNTKNNQMMLDFGNLAHKPTSPQTRRPEYCTDYSFDACVSCTEQYFGLTGMRKFVFAVLLPEFELAIMGSCLIL